MDLLICRLIECNAQKRDAFLLSLDAVLSSVDISAGLCIDLYVTYMFYLQRYVKLQSCHLVYLLFILLCSISPSAIWH